MIGRCPYHCKYNQFRGWIGCLAGHQGIVPTHGAFLSNTQKSWTCDARNLDPPTIRDQATIQTCACLIAKPCKTKLSQAAASLHNVSPPLVPRAPCHVCATTRSCLEAAHPNHLVWSPPDQTSQLMIIRRCFQTMKLRNCSDISHGTSPMSSAPHIAASMYLPTHRSVNRYPTKGSYLESK